MAIFDKIQKATQDAVRGAKEFTDTARQNSMIADEQKQIASLYSQIGKMYYESGEYDPETTLGRLCIAIKASFDRIAKHTEEIRQIKGTMRCPNCGEDIPLNSAFCGVCGTRIEQTAGFTPTAAAAKTCASCGAVVPEGSMFCTGCGQRQ